jgi:hypothetical protein
MRKLTNSMAIFNGYVSLPEGIWDDLGPKCGEGWWIKIRLRNLMGTSQAVWLDDLR